VLHKSVIVALSIVNAAFTTAPNADMERRDNAPPSASCLIKRLIITFPLKMRSRDAADTRQFFVWFCCNV
jgi:hypothetical protein